ncbi:MAG: HU family DNA-binding protein [Cetobacterium sp.]|nr:HU family DNA-binding protein [Cetobacterium sp.]
MLKKDFLKIVKDTLDKRDIKTKDIKEVDLLVNAFFNTISENLEKEEVINFLGFGKFKVIEKAARTGKNPRTGETIQIEAKKTIKFKSSKDLIKKINLPKKISCKKNKK